MLSAFLLVSPRQESSSKWFGRGLPGDKPCGPHFSAFCSCSPPRPRGRKDGSSYVQFLRAPARLIVGSTRKNTGQKKPSTRRKSAKAKSKVCFRCTRNQHQGSTTYPAAAVCPTTCGGNRSSNQNDERAPSRSAPYGSARRRRGASETTLTHEVRR